MQATTPVSKSSYYFNFSYQDFDPVLKIFFACILNTSITIYQISKKNIKHLKYYQVVPLIFSVTNPLIPVLTILLIATLVTSITLKALNKKNPTWTKACNTLANFSITNTLALSRFTFFIHELGHAALAKCFFKNPQITIKIFPFIGGETTYTACYGLTKIGNFLGRERSILLTAAGGFLASTAACLLLTKASQVFKSQSLKYLAISQIFAELAHALSSLMEKTAIYENDYTYLMEACSFHPLIPISIMAASCFYSISLK